MESRDDVRPNILCRFSLRGRDQYSPGGSYIISPFNGGGTQLLQDRHPSLRNDRHPSLRNMSMLWSGQGGSKSNKGKTERSGLGFGWSSARPSASEDPAKGRSKSFADLHQRQDEKSRPGHEANPSRQEIIGPYNSSSGLEYDYAGVHAHEKVRPSDDGSLSCEHCGRSEIYPDHGSHRAVYNNSHSKPNDCM